MTSSRADTPTPRRDPVPDSRETADARQGRRSTVDSTEVEPARPRVRFQPPADTEPGQPIFQTADQPAAASVRPLVRPLQLDQESLQRLFENVTAEEEPVGEAVNVVA